jgi:hypothetical protein
VFYSDAEKSVWCLFQQAVYQLTDNPLLTLDFTCPYQSKTRRWSLSFVLHGPSLCAPHPLPSPPVENMGSPFRLNVPPPPPTVKIGPPSCGQPP